MQSAPAERIAALKPKRRRTQFSLRALMALVLAICVPLAWSAVKLDAKRRERAALAGLGLMRPTVYIKPFSGQTRELEGGYCYDWALRGNDRPPGPRWLHALLGADFFGKVAIVQCYDPSMTDADLARLEAFPALKGLHILHAEISDAGLAHVGRLTELRNLNLTNVPITDDGLRHITGLKKLRGLRLGGRKSKLTDAGLAHLRQLKTLEVLVLSSKEHFSAAGLDKLQRDLPDCRIIFNWLSRDFPVRVLED
jgi:hypothetical protein